MSLVNGIRSNNPGNPIDLEEYIRLKGVEIGLPEEHVKWGWAILPVVLLGVFFLARRQRPAKKEEGEAA